MKSFFSSNQGVESAPLILIFAAVVMVLTASIVFPALMEWQDQVNKAQTIKEASRLRDAISRTHSMGDVGSVEWVILNIPRGHCLQISGGKIYARGPCEGPEMDELIEGGLELDADVEASTGDINGKILSGEGTITCAVAYWPERDNIDKQPCMIIVRG